MKKHKNKKPVGIVPIRLIGADWTELKKRAR